MDDASDGARYGALQMVAIKDDAACVICARRAAHDRATDALIPRSHLVVRLRDLELDALSKARLRRQPAARRIRADRARAASHAAA